MITRRIYQRQIQSLSEVTAAVSHVRPKWAPNEWPKSALIRTHLETRRVLEISGPDAGVFLQGLISNDIRRNDELLYTGFFTHKGRYLFDAFVWRDEQNAKWRLDVADSALDTVLQHIKRYRLRSKLELEDISDRVGIENFTCPDPILSQQLRRDLTTSCPGSQACIDPRSHSIGVRCYLPGDNQPQSDLLHAFSNIPEPDSYYDAWQMINGIPRYGHELIPDKTIPLEANLDLLNAIAFTKGCYLGQELIARSHFTGVIRKRIVPFLLSDRKESVVDHPLFPTASIDSSWASNPIQPGTKITSGSGSVGKVLSNLGNLGMALIRLEPLFHPPSTFVCDQFQLHPIIPSYFAQMSTSS